MASYHRPRELDEALAVLREGAITVIAGGTDYYPVRVERLANEDLLDITAIAALRRIDTTASHFRIGAGVTWTDLIRAELPPCFDGLKRAGREVGGVQIQNVGTLAGNVCNASPAADGVPCLMALETEVELASAAGTRTLRLEDFILGPRKTARRPDELVLGLRIPCAHDVAQSVFLKLGSRRYLVISIVMLAAVITRAVDGRITRARIAVGACAATAKRLPALEAALIGAHGDTVTILDEHLAPLSPIDDIRAPAAYRRQAVSTLLRRALRP